MLFEQWSDGLRCFRYGFLIVLIAVLRVFLTFALVLVFLAVVLTAFLEEDLVGMIEKENIKYGIRCIHCLYCSDSNKTRLYRNVTV